jgi:hypothetical protein
VVVWTPFPVAPWGHAGPVPPPATVGPFMPVGPQGQLVEGVQALLGQVFLATRVKTMALAHVTGLFFIVCVG